MKPEISYNFLNGPYVRIVDVPKSGIQYSVKFRDVDKNKIVYHNIAMNLIKWRVYVRGVLFSAGLKNGVRH